MFSLRAVRPGVIDTEIPGIVPRLPLSAPGDIPFRSFNAAGKAPDVGIPAAYLPVALVLHEILLHTVPIPFPESV